MQKDFLSFLKAIFIFSIIVGVATFGMSVILPGGNIKIITWIILGYFILLTIVFHYGLLSSSKGKPQAFIRYYMGATTFKLFIHIIVILVYCLLNRDRAVPFIVTFLIYYLLYTGFETIYSVKKFRR
jgi:hypothetical protein